ncbi:phage tail tape measure protein [Stutzerimonas nitrititolerans]|uniref:phage tail tape measure protein n=1 Tax=Stutzerimonas nitrititolerans TaxID=2482751 RepID=UPI0028AFE9F7|nr:phage tail tape measure protein [Stutzerimonas nitrititolerans]
MATNNAALNFILKLTDQVSAPLGKVKMGFNELAEKGEQNIKQMGIGLAGMVGAGMAINESLQPALEMNRALGEVASLGVAGDALEALNTKALQFSVAYGENAQAFVASAYSIEGAIKGLTGSQLATFTNTSNLLAKATKGDAETMSAYLGTMYNTFKGQADAMGKSAWVEQLGGQTALAVQLFRTSGAQIGEAFKAAGGLASTAGVDLAEQMAVLGTLGSTMEGGEAGGLYKAFFENISGASEKLGMSFVDQQGKLLPMMDILDKLQGKFGDLSIEANGKALRDAFGGEAARLITTLMGDTGRLANGMEQLGKVRGLETAEQMAKAMVDPWQQFGAAVQALRIAFGQALIPLLTPLMERLTAIAATITRWIGLFPNIAKVIGMVTLGVLGLIAAVAGLTVLNGVFGMLSVLASPIALIVAGLAALVIGVGAAIYYWDDLKAAFGDTAWFQAIVVMLTPVVMLFRVFGALLNVLWVGLQQVVAFGVELVTWLASLEVVTTAAKAIWDGFIWALTNLSPFALLGSALKGLIAMLNKIPGINIDTSFADMPAMPSVPGGEVVMTASEQAERAQKAQATINDAIPGLSPQRANAVPPGGLLTSIQNTSNQNRGNHVEKVEIHTGKPMSPLELENMLSMAVGG